MSINLLESTCVGAIYAALVMLRDRGDTLAGKSCVIFGDGERAKILEILLKSVDAKVIKLSECNSREHKVVFVLDSQNMRLCDVQDLLSLQCKCLCEVSGESNKAILEPKALDLILQSRICYAPAILNSKLAENVLEIFEDKEIEILELGELLKNIILEREEDMQTLQACSDLMQRVSSHAKARFEPTNFMLGAEILIRI